MNTVMMQQILIANGKIDLVINTPRGRSTRRDGQHIRVAATKYLVPCVTTIAAGRALASGIAEWEKSAIEVASLQKMHENVQMALESNHG
jgi:carbamoyl-phosphate synthase large subunit